MTTASDRYRPSVARTLCPRCQRPADLCWCQGLEPVTNPLPVRVFRHEKEASHPLNTARILALGLADCEIIEVGDRQIPEPVKLSDPWLLFPGESALCPDQLPAGSPGTLVVPDGTWRKCRAMVLGSPWLQSLPRLLVPVTGPSLYRLRKCARPDSLSTLEAVVHVLSTFEQNTEKYRHLTRALETMMRSQEKFLPATRRGR